MRLELAPPARRERVRLQEVRNAVAYPARRVERIAQDERVPLDQDDFVAVTCEGKACGEPADSAAEDGDLRHASTDTAVAGDLSAVRSIGPTTRYVCMPA